MFFSVLEGGYRRGCFLVFFLGGGPDSPKTPTTNLLYYFTATSVILQYFIHYYVASKFTMGKNKCILIRKPVILFHCNAGNLLYYFTAMRMIMQQISGEIEMEFCMPNG